MALIMVDKQNIESKAFNSEYLRIILNDSYINGNGLYVRTLVYKNKNHRKKDKYRADPIRNFLTKVITKKNNILNEILTKASISNIDELTEEQEKDSVIHQLILDMNIYTRFYDDVFNYNSIFITEFEDENFMKAMQTEISFLNENLEYVKDIDYKSYWIEDPCIIISDAYELIAEYNKQDFNLETFYNEYKKSMSNVDNIELVDDL